MMMDSHHPSRVYDEDTLASGGTNADIVSDILLDLPISRQKEAVSPEWHRDEDILGFHPDLIIIHYSAFLHGSLKGPRQRLRLFIEFFADSDTRFIIYSRAPQANLQERVEDLLAELDQEHPGLSRNKLPGRPEGLGSVGPSVSWNQPETPPPAGSGH